MRCVNGESGDEHVDVSFAGDGRHFVTQQLQRRYPFRRLDGYAIVAAQAKTCHSDLGHDVRLDIAINHFLAGTRVGVGSD